MKVFFVLAILGRAYQLTAGVKCPDGSLTPDCTCYVEHCQDRIHVQCNFLNTTPSLAQQVQTFRNVAVGSLKIFDINTNALPDNLFQEVCVQELQIFRGNLKSLSSAGTPFPAGTSTNCLKSLGVFMGYEFNSWNWNLLKPTEQLKVLKILSSPVKNVPATFSNIAGGKLENVSLCFANIDNIEDKAFASFENIMELRLSSNSLKTFRRTLLPATANKLELLDFKKNLIDTLPKDMFANMAALKKVDISYNNIKDLPEEVFKPVWSNLESLNINGNPLNCDCNMKWLITAIKKSAIANDLDKATCATPANLKGTIISNLTETELIC